MDEDIYFPDKRAPNACPGVTVKPDLLFKAMSDLTRLRTLMLLSAEGELCVCELTHALNEIQPKISRHLAQLREAGLVLDRRQGQWIYYRLNPDQPHWVCEILALTAEGAMQQAPFADDLRVLHAMPNRPGHACCA
jgi:ArsR family transcriptional regulator